MNTNPPEVIDYMLSGAFVVCACLGIYWVIKGKAPSPFFLIGVMIGVMTGVALTWTWRIFVRR
jgi:hypothetical protein